MTLIVAAYAAGLVFTVRYSLRVQSRRAFGGYVTRGQFVVIIAFWPIVWVWKFVNWLEL